ncbi:hypothetical protein KCP75_00905 [Salmonella enterica subsp. enterica]|nr:hypothetical protein KCP75_00905 [Salmonella enterica subsp. enterica]
MKSLPLHVVPELASGQSRLHFIRQKPSTSGISGRQSRTDSTIHCCGAAFLSTQK